MLLLLTYYLFIENLSVQLSYALVHALYLVVLDALLTLITLTIIIIHTNPLNVLLLSCVYVL